MVHRSPVSLPWSPSAVASMQFQEADSGTMCVQFCHFVTHVDCPTQHDDEYTPLCSPNSVTVPVC